jgi:DegV family protein with EDD domain
MSIAVVTDSTADIPVEMAANLHIKVVPAILIINGVSVEDGTGITRNEFYERLPNMDTPPTTATPSVGTFERIYTGLFEAGCQYIVSIHVSSLLSGIYSTAQLAAKSFGDKVSVIDSGQLSLGLGFQVLAAAESIASRATLGNVLKEVEQVRQRVRVIALLDTLEYIRRSGRVSWTQARIGNFLQIKPFLEIKEGKVHNIGQTRTRKKGIELLSERIQNLGEIDKLAILHTNAEKDAHLLIRKLGQLFSEKPLIINVTTIVGTHVGPNGLGFAAVLS